MDEYQRPLKIESPILLPHDLFLKIRSRYIFSLKCISTYISNIMMKYKGDFVIKQVKARTGNLSIKRTSCCEVDLLIPHRYCKYFYYTFKLSLQAEIKFINIITYAVDTFFKSFSNCIFLESKLYMNLLTVFEVSF